MNTNIYSNNFSDISDDSIESSIIQKCYQFFPGYIGDDAAVIPYIDDLAYIITKDILLEDVHFRTCYFSPLDIAHKALHANLSDIAAMGAHCKFILCGVSAPDQHINYCKDFLHSIAKLCKSLDIQIIGGDTTKSTDKIYISITAIGVAKISHIKYRNTAQIGDKLCIIGDNIGYARIGFEICEEWRNNKRNNDSCKDTLMINDIRESNVYIDRFLRPEARIAEGIYCGENSCVRAMMDISDGLLVDLQRLCSASRVSAKIHLEELENSIITSSFYDQCNRLSISPLSIAVSGGEDYGLLISVDGKLYHEFATEFRARFSSSLICFGTVCDNAKKEGVRMAKSIVFERNNEIIDEKSLDLDLFSHFV